MKSPRLSKKGAEVVVWNAVNFGSGWFPELTKRDGLSGARSLAEALADHVAASGVPTAAELAEADSAFCAEVFGQPCERVHGAGTEQQRVTREVVDRHVSSSSSASGGASPCSHLARAPSG